MKKVFFGILSTLLVFGLASCDGPVNNSFGHLVYTPNLVVLESSANDGSFSSVIEIKVVRDKFKETLNADAEYAITGLPAGLNASLVRVDEKNATLTISGSVANADECREDVVGLNFYSKAFQSGRLPQNAIVDMLVKTIGAGYSPKAGGLTESSPNAGTIGGSVEITLTGGGQVVPDSLGLDTHYKVVNGEVPAGLALNIAKGDDDETLVVSLLGTAEDHTAGNSTSIKIEFLSTDDDEGTSSPFNEGAFCENDKVTFDLSISFEDCATLAFNPTTLSESEDPLEAGEIVGSVTVSITNGEFADAFDDSLNILFDGTPGGLTPEALIDEDTGNIIISFDGAAGSHSAADSTTVDVEFLASALAGGFEFCDDADGNAAEGSIDLVFVD